MRILLVAALLFCSNAYATFNINQMAAQNLTSAGTAQAVSSATLKVKDAVLVADPGNAGTIYIGDSSVDSTNGIPLTAGQSASLSTLVGSTKDRILYDLNQIYFDGGTTNDDLRVIYFNETRP